MILAHRFRITDTRGLGVQEEIQLIPKALLGPSTLFSDLSSWLTIFLFFIQ